LQSPLNWPRSLTAPEHIYGNITISGTTAFIPAATGQLNDLMSLSAGLAGKTYEIDLAAAGAAAALTGFTLANFGGVAVYHETNGSGSSDHVLAAQVGKIQKYTATNAGASGARSRNVSLNPDSGTGINYRLMNWMRRFLSQ
jgi:type IV pilus assembly protein PilY1